MIIIRLDRVLADRKMRLNDLAAQVGISNRKSKSRPVQYVRRNLQSSEVPTGGYS